jgi:hypothetical protein
MGAIWKSPAECRAILEERLSPDAVYALRRLDKLRPRYAKLQVLPEDRARVLSAFEHRCAYCTADTGVHLGVDYLVPPKREGTAHPENLVASCDRCRTERRQRHLDVFLEGRLDLDAHAVYDRIYRAMALLRTSAQVRRVA